MDIVYSAHAVTRMRERHITVEEVEEIIKHPDGKIQQTEGKFIYYKKFKSRKDNLIASVIVIKKYNTIMVITVMVNFEVKK